MVFFYKILSGLTPKCLFDIICVSNPTCYSIWAQSKLEVIQFYNKTKNFSDTVFTFVIKELDKLDAKIRNIPYISEFKKLLLIYFKTDENLIFDIHNSLRIKFLKKLRLNFGHLNEYRFRRNFRATVNTLCDYLLRCLLFSD